MKRPLFVIGFTSLWSMLIVSLTSPKVSVLILGASGVMFIVSIFVKPIRQEKLFPVVFATLMIVNVLFLIKTELVYNPVIAMSGKEYEFTGTVIGTSGKNSSDSYVYTVKIENTDTLKVPKSSFKIKLTSKNYVGRINDRIKFCGKVYVPGEFLRNTDERASFGMVNYYKSQNIFIGVNSYSGVTVLKEGDSHGVYGFTQMIRDRIRKSVSKYISKDFSGILTGMLIGDKSEIPDEIYENFKTSGTVHLLSVSGFHCSLWGMIIYRALLKSGLNKRISSAFAILFLFMFTLLTGMSKSTVRAALMLSVFFLGRIFTRDPDSLNSLGFAAIIIVFTNPFVCGDSGFLFSFFSTLGIFLLYPKMKQRVRPIIKKKIHNFYVRQRVNTLSDTVLITLCTMILNFPFVMLFTGNTSLVSPFTNLLVTPLSSLAIFMTGIGSLLDVIPLVRSFANPTFFIAGISAKLIVFITERISLIALASVMTNDDITVAIVCSVIIIIAFSFLLKKVRPAFAAFLCTAFFCICETVNVIANVILQM